MLTRSYLYLFNYPYQQSIFYTPTNDNGKTLTSKHKVTGLKERFKDAKGREKLNKRNWGYTSDRKI